MNWGSHLSAVLIIGLGLLLAVSSADENQYIVRQEYDICNPNTEVTYPNTIYLPGPESTTEVYAYWSPRPYQPTEINCLLYIRTCDNCRIQVTSTGASFNYPPCSVPVTPGYDVSDDVCVPNCAYFYLFDADYRSQTSQVVTKSPVLYRTESKQLHVTACALHYNQTVNMRLQLTVKEKVREISDVTGQTRSFSSPYFPRPYAKNGELYTFKLIALETNMIVILSFDDWLIAPSSYFEFSGSKDIVSATGTNNRPFIQSEGQNLNVTFHTGDPTISQSSLLGFRATVIFISKYTDVKSSTACDQEITTEGGIIRLAIADGRARDCIFLIRKIPKFDGVYLRVLKTSIDDQSDYYDYTFDIHGGITSVGELKAHVNRNDPVPNNTILQSDDGFYIRYKGRYYAGPSHVLAYSMYIFDCDDYSGYFRCKNDLCISMFLKCDGYDHCGDGSDEYASLCTYETTHSSSSYPIGIGVIIPLVVSIFLIIVMCVLIVLIRRCRRLNNAARSRRPPGARSSRQRSRHNRDVQMNVTVRSGEHPPSYDEVLQNTPIGYLNMAFTWSQGNNLAQPPSYEEAVSPSSQQNGSIIITATANNGIGREETIRNSHPTSATLLTTTISASLDPRVEVSSSSSSDDAPDRFQQLDFSSSSDSSIENEHHLAPHSHVDNSRSNTNLNKAGKDLDNDIGSLSSFPKYVNNESAQVVFGSPGSGKVNFEGQERVKPAINQLMDESHGNKNPNNAGGSQFVKEARDQYQSFSDLRNASNSREVQGLPSSERFDGRSRGTQNHTMSGSEDFRNAERESKQARARVDMYHKNKGKHSHQHVGRESGGTYANGLTVHPPKVTDSSRSQSCFDLSLGAGAVKLLEGGSAAMRNEDKRFSYAGAGDTSLVREGLGQFYNGRGLIREKPLEHLDRYASQTYDDVRDGNTLRKHNKIDYEAGNEQDEDQHHRPRKSSTPSGHFPKGTRDKTDSLRAKGQCSSLASVTENLYDEAYVPDPMPKATDRHMYNEHTDKLKKPSTNSNWPQSTRNPLESARGSSQAHEVLSSQKTNPESRGPSREHLLPGSTRSLPAKTMAMTPGHNYVHSHDRRKPTSDERSREQAENRSSRSSSDIQNLSTNSRKSTAHSAMQDVASNSRDSGSAEHNKVPQSDQDTAASMFRPKPSLRKSRMKNAQRPDGHVAESSNRSSQGHTQASQKPVPAPRHGIQKPEPGGGRRPQPDAPHEWGMQGASRAQTGHNERRDDSSRQTGDQANSRDHISVEATNDDVFV
ncbi:hypothetical protein BsWGS_16511 [Bradybaena similaris]